MVIWTTQRLQEWNVVPLGGTEGQVVTLRLRTALFVPADRPERIAKAVAQPTDAVVVDFEDAVADSAKESARATAVRAIGGVADPHPHLMVRVNAADTPWFADDVAALEPVLDTLAAVVLPMTTTAEDVLLLEQRLTTAGGRRATTNDVRIVPIVETAAGVLAAREIAAASDRVETLLFGAADLSTELQVEATAKGEELLHARSHVVLAAAAAGVSRPVDGPYLRLDDLTGLGRSTEHARALGFAGKAVIHPSQLDTVASVLAPTAEEVRWARNVDEAFTAAERDGRASIRLDDGTFVDYPVARRARAILTEADVERTA
jgi:citrate lyase subunit beta / citryl-CoA lyase